MERIIFILALIAIFFSVFYKLHFKDYCIFDFECDWQITNCCPENAGARWECVNLKSFEKPKCEGLILCPQIISPKPKEKCVCFKWKCVSK